MAITTLPRFTVPAWWNNTAGTSLGPTSVLLNASGDRVAFVIQAPKAGTLDKFEFRIGAVNNNPDNGLRPSFQTIDLATGNPDGTQSQYRDITGTFTGQTWQEPGLMTSDGTDSGTKRTVAAGELIGCVVDFVNFVASDSINISVMSGLTSMNRNWYVVDGSAGTYTKSSSSYPLLALKYDDGTYAEFVSPCWPIMTLNPTGFNSGSSPDERALRFQVGVSQRLVGAWAILDVDAAVDVVLYDAASSVIGTPVSFDPDQRSTVNSLYYEWYFDPVTLTAATTYRLSVKPTSGSSITAYDFDLPSVTYQQCIPGGVEWYLSTRTDAGSWSDSTAKRPAMGLIFDGVETGGGGGGGESSASYFG